MKRVVFLTFLTSLLLLGKPSPPAAEAQPAVSHVFHGTVTIGGAPAPGGVAIEARIGGVNYAYTSAGDHIPRTASDGTYGKGFNNLNVLADDPGTPEKEGGVNGELISFFVGTSPEVAGTASYQSGAVTEKNLFVSSLPTPTPTSTPTPTPTSTPVPAIDVILNVYAECSNNSNVTVDRFTPSAGAVVTSSAPVTSPILDRNSDGVVSFADAVSSNANMQVQSIDGANGVITLRCLAAFGNGILGGNDGIHFTLTYKQGLPTPTPVPLVGSWALVIVGLLFSALAFWRMARPPHP